MRRTHTLATTPGTSSRAPAAAAIAFTVLMACSLWWQTRPEPPAPIAQAPVEAGTTGEAERSGEHQPEPVPTQVVAFSSFAGEGPPSDSPATRAYTARGMRLLAEAIAVRGDSILWRDRAKRLVEAADEVEGAPEPAQAAAVAHEALGLAAEWVADLRAGAPAAGSPDPLAAAAQSIARDELLRDQADRIERFFEAAASALGGAGTST